MCRYSRSSVSDPHHFDGHSDSDLNFYCDADPDSSFQIKAQNLEQVLKQAHIPYILACHLPSDADPDPDPAYHFDGDHVRTQTKALNKISGLFRRTTLPPAGWLSGSTPWPPSCPRPHSWQPTIRSSAQITSLGKSQVEIHSKYDQFLLVIQQKVLKFAFLAMFLY